MLVMRCDDLLGAQGRVDPRPDRGLRREQLRHLGRRDPRRRPAPIRKSGASEKPRQDSARAGTRGPRQDRRRNPHRGRDQLGLDEAVGRDAETRAIRATDAAAPDRSRRRSRRPRSPRARLPAAVPRGDGPQPELPAAATSTIP